MQPCAVVILGPTATGKSALALAVASRFPAEIISMDSALIYRGMDIGTAKPSVAERAQTVHHLIDICDAADSYSAAAFAADAQRLIADICARGRLPIICGGTMLYYKALTQGLSPLPATEPAVREAIRREGETLGWPVLHARLKTIDPPLYAKYAPNDKQRIARALEVYTQTGRALSSFYTKQESGCAYPRLEFVLLPAADRVQLRAAIRERFLKMLADGLLDEVAALRRRGDLNLDLPSMRCVGYRQTWQYLAGSLSYEAMIEQSVIATAKLAKHQMTWLRGALASGERTALTPGDAHNVDVIMSALKAWSAFTPPPSQD